MTGINNTPPPDVARVSRDIVRPPARLPTGTTFGIGASHWSEILSKSPPKMSDEEFLYKARELARIDFSKGEREGPEIGKLVNDYISVVSPDRKSLIKSTVKDISDSSKKSTYINHLWQAFLLYEQGVDALKNISGLAVTATGEVHSMTIHDSAGNPLVSYNRDSGWAALLTHEEWTRFREMFGVYNDEWFALYKDSKSENNKFELMQNDMGVGAFDVVG